ncbi:glycohydrolase toxin TNT-related protein [Halomonas denitrificans]|nr:glycohydrolase toxin TNT-related protein [Halomonas denitrificans]
MDLIHMNGRVYDYNLGRFLSVDPFIQAPTSTQSVNPYSYIMNNPLAGTDPTGYMGCAASRIESVCDRTLSNHGGNGKADASFFGGGSGSGNQSSRSAKQSSKNGNGSSRAQGVEAKPSEHKKKTWNQSAIERSGRDYSDPEVEAAAEWSPFEDEGELTASRGGRRSGRNATTDPMQPVINRSVQLLINQIQRIDPHYRYSTARPSSGPGSQYHRGDISYLQGVLAQMREPLVWPPNMGFQGTSRSTTLRPGSVVDRYGSPGGYFVAPIGTPFGQRSLPEHVRGLRYTRFEVLKPINVRSGPAAPWFGQSGGGTQFLLPQRASTLIRSGHLRIINE